MTKPVAIKQLSFAYEPNSGNPVLQEIGLTIEQNSFVSIIGPNGSGKSTLLKHIAKLIPAKANRIVINGRDINQYSIKSLARVNALVPQQNHFEYNFTAFEVVMMGRHPHIDSLRGESKTDIAIVEEAMRQTDTYRFKDRPINALSGGERQRVILARAIVQDAQIMLLDEPISFLDIHHQIDIVKRIREHAKVSNKTVIAVLHDLNFALKFSDRIVLLHEGMIISQGMAEQVLTTDNIKKAYGIDVELIYRDDRLDYILPIIE